MMASPPRVLLRSITTLPSWLVLRRLGWICAQKSDVRTVQWPEPDSQMVVRSGKSSCMLNLTFTPLRSLMEPPLVSIAPPLAIRPGA